MAVPAPSEGETAAADPEEADVRLDHVDLERLTELVYQLLREDVTLTRERRGDAAARWR